MPTTTLSARGASAAANSDSPIWEVLSDQWSPETNPSGYVSLGVAENALMHSELSSYIARKPLSLPSHAFTYGDGAVGSKRLRNALARFLNRHFNPISEVKADHVIVTNGCTTAVEHCAWILGDDGDGFLLGQPHYGAFVSDFGLRPGVAAVTVPFGDVDPCGIEGVGKYEEALLKAKEKGVKVKALMLCSPHNPLGRCYGRETIVALMRLCQKYHIHFISDEIYALSVWKNMEDESPKPVEFVSALSIDLEGVIDPNLVHVLWGMSKDFGANGLRLGSVVSQHNSEFVAALTRVSLYSYSSSVSDNIAANLLEDDEFTDFYIKNNQQRLSDSYSYVIQFLRRYGIPYAPGANAAFFVWVNLGSVFSSEAYTEDTKNSKHDKDIDTTSEIMSKLLEKKIFLADGERFGSEVPGWFRIVFSQPRPLLEEGLRRMIEALGVQEIESRQFTVTTGR